MIVTWNERGEWEGKVVGGTLAVKHHLNFQQTHTQLHFPILSIYPHATNKQTPETHKHTHTYTYTHGKKMREKVHRICGEDEEDAWRKLCKPCVYMCVCSAAWSGWDWTWMEVTGDECQQENLSTFSLSHSLSVHFPMHPLHLHIHTSFLSLCLFIINVDESVDMLDTQGSYFQHWRHWRWRRRRRWFTLNHHHHQLPSPTFLLSAERERQRWVVDSSMICL